MAEEKEKCEIDIEKFIQEFEIDFPLSFNKKEEEPSP